MEQISNNIKVAVRCRPMNEREMKAQSSSCFSYEKETLKLTNDGDAHSFAFDFVYGSDSRQEQVYQDIGIPLYTRAFEGYNGTIFAYGQTGSGKSFSMQGVAEDAELEGLIPRMNKGIFEKIEQDKSESMLYLVECSYFEIYNEIIYDLLDESKNGKKGGLEIKEHAVLGIYVKGLQERVVACHKDVTELMAQGQAARTVGSTSMNAESSRSHSIFVIKIHQKDVQDETKSIFAKINLVDLAGSERAASTGAKGTRLKEGANINKSLSALGNVINALVEVARSGKKVFIPYRNSKLTRVLQESLGGNSLCTMLAALSPATINFTETLSTLKYANRAKSIKVNAKKNEESSQVSKLNDEIEILKRKLAEQASKTLDPVEKNDLVSKYEKQITEMDEIRKQTWEDKMKQSKKHEAERKRLAKEKLVADKMIQEEKTKKWNIALAKVDMELAIKFCKDLQIEVVEWENSLSGFMQHQTTLEEHRSLIAVFKSSFDQDVNAWADIKLSTNGQGQHVLLQQAFSKLASIQSESKQLFKIAQKGLTALQTLHNNINARSQQTDNGLQDKPKHEKLLFRDQQVALKMTLRIAEQYRENYFSRTLDYYKSLFDLQNSCTALCDGLQQDSRFEGIVEELIAGAKCCQLLKRPEDIKATFVLVGDVDSLSEQGEIKVPFIASTCYTEASLPSIDSSCPWVPLPTDEHPFIQFELLNPHSIRRVSIKGGENMDIKNNIRVTKAVITSATAASICEKYKLAELDGNPASTYELLGAVVDWQKLLKSSKIPTKLFARPPVRFLHDIISNMTAATNYDSNLFSSDEKNYESLSSKSLKVAYFKKLIDKVKQTFTDEIAIEIDAANMASGQEATATLHFLQMLAIACLRNCHENNSNTSSAEFNLNEDGWVQMCTISVSEDGVSWMKGPDMEACTNSNDLARLILTDEQQNIPANFLRLHPTKWNCIAALRLDIVGQKMEVADTTLLTMDSYAGSYTTYLASLDQATKSLLESASEAMQIEKDTINASEAKMIELLQQIEAYKTTEVELQTKLLAQKDKIGSLSTEIEDERSAVIKLQAEKDGADCQKRELEIQCNTLSRNVETCNSTISKHLHDLQELESSKADLARQASSLQQSKEDLEQLNLELRGQLTAENNVQGEVANRAQELEANLGSANVKLKEMDRKLESANAVIAEMRDNLSKNDVASKSLQEELSSKSEQISTLTMEISTNKQLLDTSTQDLSEATAKIQKLKDSTATLEATCNANASDVNQLKLTTKSLQDENLQLRSECASSVSNTKFLEAEALNLRLQAEKNSLAVKCQQLAENASASKMEHDELVEKISHLQETVDTLEREDEEYQAQLQILTEERDNSRQKEEQMFALCTEKDEEIERIRDGYVWVTDRMNDKEDELADLQDQLERYESLVKTLKPDKPVDKGAQLKRTIEEVFTSICGEGNLPTPEVMLHRIAAMFKEVKIKLENAHFEKSTATAPNISEEPSDVKNDNDDDYADDDFE